MALREIPRQRLEGDTAQARADRIMSELKAAGRTARAIADQPDQAEEPEADGA